jgi:hypothetical protein
MGGSHHFPLISATISALPCCWARPIAVLPEASFRGGLAA